MKTIRYIIFFVISAIAVFGISYIYIWFTADNEFIQNYPRTGSFEPTWYYKITPEISLASLDNNKEFLFEPKIDSSDKQITKSPVLWSQADYNKIAHKIFGQIWHDSLDSWRLYKMEFGVGCNDNPKGFDWADYIYFKEVSVNGKKQYTARDIFITPQYSEIAVGSDTNFPRPFWGWKYISTKDVNITADETLLSAENNGGKETRLTVQNKCYIHVGMNPEGYGYDYWNVTYGGNDNMAGYDTVFPSHR